MNLEDDNSSVFKNSNLSKTFLVISLFVVVYLVFAGNKNKTNYGLVEQLIYAFAYPIVALLLIMPILSFMLWWKVQFNKKSLYLYSFFISITILLFLIISNLLAGHYP